MARHERVKLELGESMKLSAKDGIKSDDNRLSKDAKGRWGSTSSAVVIKSDDLEKDVVEIVGASIGKSLVFYRQDTKLTSDEAISTSLGAGAPDAKRQIEDQYAIGFEVEVVAKEVKPAAAGKAKLQGAAAAAAAAGQPLGSSKDLDGRLPMNEVQEEPSEKAPYGLDQQNKPVAPVGSMVNPDQSNVARQSEGAESAKAAGKTASSRKGGSKKAAKKGK
jgi:hypothetical protein